MKRAGTQRLLAAVKRRWFAIAAVAGVVVGASVGYLVGEGRVSPEPPHRNGGSNGDHPNGNGHAPDPGNGAALEASSQN